VRRKVYVYSTSEMSAKSVDMYLVTTCKLTLIISHIQFTFINIAPIYLHLESIHFILLSNQFALSLLKQTSQDNSMMQRDVRKGEKESSEKLCNFSLQLCVCVCHHSTGKFTPTK
jgi:hypothetical protein